MDDFISFSDSKIELWNLKSKIDDFLNNQLNLKLKKSVTQVAPVREGIPFLGFRIFPNLVRLKHENLIRMIRKINKKEAEYSNGVIERKDLVNSVGSIIAHVQHANALMLRRHIFK